MEMRIVGQNHIILYYIYSICMEILAGSHQIYSHIRCNCTILANPRMCKNMCATTSVTAYETNCDESVFVEQPRH